jgi:Ohr subfamily peroxiredoxin
MGQAIYTAVATARGDGRNGEVTSSDGVIDESLAIPKEMGGPGGDKTNPEQLFAAGYSACFLGAVHAVGREMKLDTNDAAVSASVSIGPSADTGFEIAAELDIYIPNVTADEARTIAETAHRDICPYSKAISGNVPVVLNIVE